MAEWGEFKTAQDIEKAIRRIVTDELNKQRPVARYAVVNSIDLVDRSIMGTFIGDDLPVRLPFLDTIPADVGQEVRVTGIGSDRVVDGVRGSSDAEARVASTETEMELRAPSFGSFYRLLNGSLGSGVTKLAWTGNVFEPVNFPALIAGTTEAIFPTDGYYEVSLTVSYSGASDKNFYVQVLPAAGGEFDLFVIGSQFTDCGVDDISVSGRKTWYFREGDRICVNAAGADAFDVYGGNRTTWEIKRIWAGPKVEPAEVP